MELITFLPMLVIIGAFMYFASRRQRKAMQATIDLHESLPLVPGFFNLTYIRNTGAAWGMFSGQNLALAVLAVAMLAALVAFRRKILPPGRLHRVALGLLCGGIAGNLFDRLRLDYVVDFLDFFHRGWHFPAFNVADSAICVAVGIYVLASLFAQAPAPAAEPPAP